jgi:hypothetical protein
MTTKIRLAFALAAVIILTVLVLPGSIVKTRSQSSSLELQLIKEFDDCIQQRFLDIDKAFGLRRIIKEGESPHRFKPESARELTSVGRLKEQGLDVALYLTSRSVLGEKPAEAAWQQESADTYERTKPLTPQILQKNFLRKLIRGPVLITAMGKDELPNPSQLWQQSQSAMKAFAGKEQYEFAQGQWQFIARPVRASDESCLHCHVQDSTHIVALDVNDERVKSLKIGDPLGVLLYAYRERK